MSRRADLVAQMRLGEFEVYVVYKGEVCVCRGRGNQERGLD
jgi:hypothetical protein